MTVREEPSPSSSVTKNVNVYWLGASGLAIWFLFIHAPPLLRERHALMDPAFAWHLVGAYTLYLACMFNTLVTPSVNRSLHVWVGRVGMIAGVFGFLLGLYLSWWPWRDLPPLDFSIGITVGGLAQIILQTRGYLAIRRFQRLREELENKSGSTTESDSLLEVDHEQIEADKIYALRVHIESMIGLFVIACGTPAAMRLSGKVGVGGLPAMLAIVAVFIFIARRYTKNFVARLPLSPTGNTAMTSS